MQTCHHPDCQRTATHWLVRHLDAGYLPNPDVRAYCEVHRIPDAATAVASTRAPVQRVEFVEIAVRPAV